MKTKKYPMDINLTYNNTLLITFIQILYGAFTAGLKAGYILNSFPLIGGYLFPKGMLEVTPIFYYLVNNPICIQIIHRFIAVILVILISFYVYSVSSLNYLIKSNASIMILIIILQFILGVLTLISQVSIVFASCHQVLAVILILTIIKNKHS